MDLTDRWRAGLPHIETAERQDFRQEAIANFPRYNQPIVFRGGAASWPSSAWTISGLSSRLKGRSVSVARDPTQLILDAHGRRVLKETWEASDYLRLLEEGSPDLDNSYLSKLNILELAPELAKDLRFFKDWQLCAKFKVYSWISPAHSASPFHYDLPNNIFVQILGRKTFLFAPPIGRKRMRVHPRGTEGTHISRIVPDFAMTADLPWDLFRVVTLEEGDILYLPSCWWHFVYSETVSLSVNGWMIDFWAVRPQMYNLRRVWYAISAMVGVQN